jgi:hypothetical protein
VIRDLDQERLSLSKELLGNSRAGREKIRLARALLASVINPQKMLEAFRLENRMATSSTSATKSLLKTGRL